MKKNVNLDISVIFSEKKYVFFETFNGKPDGKSNPKTLIRYDEKSQEMYCILCEEFPAIADTKSPLYTGCKNLRDQPLKTHQQSSKHLSCLMQSLAQLFPAKQPMTKVIRKISDKTRDKLIALFNTAFFIAKSNIALHDFLKLWNSKVKTDLTF